METRDKVIAIMEPVLKDRGLDLVDVEWRREGHGSILRLVVDRAGGVDLDALGGLSREVSDLLDGEDAVLGAYMLEVSSPGINRALRTADHFRSFEGKRVRVRTREPIDGQRNFLGRLEAVSEAGVIVSDASGKEVSIPFPRIERANYEHEFSAADFAPGATRATGPERTRVDR